MGRWQLIIVSVYVHCKTHRKRSGIEMNETLNLHRQRTKWTADIELDNKYNTSYIYFGDRTSNKIEDKIQLLTVNPCSYHFRTSIISVISGTGKSRKSVPSVTISGAMTSPPTCST